MNSDKIKAEQERVKKLIAGRQRGGRTRGRKDGMNKLEQAYAEHLEARRLIGELDAWEFEPHTFMLVDSETFVHRVAFTPDFCITYAGSERKEYVDVKGHWEDDARVKIKLAAALYSQYIWTAAQRKRGEWQHEYFLCTLGGGR